MTTVVIAVMSVYRVALKAIVETSLSQGAWIWLSAARQRRKKKTEPARLEDFKMFDEASRGLWGSIVLVWRLRGVHFACIGAGIIILIHGFETFSSTMVQTENRPHLLRNVTKAPPIARSETWSNVENKGWGGESTLKISTKASVYSGFMATNIVHTPAFCDATNCTWPIFPSLAVCGNCSDALYRQSCTLNDGCTYTMASGNSVSVGVSDSESHFSVTPTNGSVDAANSSSQAYFSFFDVMKASRNAPHNTVEAYTCALWFCLNSYNVMATGGHQNTTIVDTWSKTKFASWNSAHEDEYVFVDIPPSMHAKENTRYHVPKNEIGILNGFMALLTWGRTSTVGGHTDYSSDWIQAMSTGADDLSSWMANLTLSMTNDVRISGTVDQANLYQYSGSAYEMASYVTVSWPWVVYPFILMFFAFAYLIQTVWRTARDQVSAWKCDSLPMLFAHIDKGIHMIVRDGMDVPEGLNDRVGRTEVELVRKTNGQWIFKLLQ